MLTQVFLHGVVHSLKQAESLPPIFTRWVSQSVKQSLHSFLEAVKPEWCEAACENVIACLLVRNISVWFTASLCPEIPPFNSWMRMCLWRVRVSAPSDRSACHFTSRVTLHISAVCTGFLQQVPSPTRTQYVSDVVVVIRLNHWCLVFCLFLLIVDRVEGF